MSLQTIIPLTAQKDCNIDEKDLLQLVAEGDEKAFSQLFCLYRNKVFSHALTFTKSGQEAEELVTDIFMKVWNCRSQLPSIANFKSYLFILAKNHLVSSIRKKVMITVEASVDEWCEDILQPDKQFHLKETRQAIMNGLQKLSPQQKKIFEMSRFQGLTYKQIATILLISPRTVKFHMILALNFLREYVRNYELLPLFIFLALFLS